MHPLLRTMPQVLIAFMSTRCTCSCVQVGGHIIGKLLRSHSLPGDDYRGLAASREGTHVALTSEDTGTVCVLSLPSLSPGFVFGGDGDAPGQFR